MSIIAIETLALEALAAAPPGANPFYIIKEVVVVVKTQEGTYPPSYIYQLYVLSGLVGLNILMILIIVGTAGIKASRDQFWVVTTRNGYILPHWKFSWGTALVLFFGLLEGLIWKTIQAFNGAR